LCGVILIAKPKFLFPNYVKNQNSTKTNDEFYRTLGITLGLLSGVIRAGVIAAIRSLGTKVSVFKLLHFLCMVQIIQVYYSITIFLILYFFCL